MIKNTLCEIIKELIKIQSIVTIPETAFVSQSMVIFLNILPKFILYIISPLNLLALNISLMPCSFIPL